MTAGRRAACNDNAASKKGSFMCNIPLISSFLMLAQLSFGGSIAFFGAAAAINGNIFRFAGAPVAIGLGALALIATVAMLRAAARAAAGCAGKCASQTTKLLTDIAALIAAIAVLGTAIAATAILASFPFAAAAAIAAIVVALTLAGLMFLVLAMDLAALSACAGATGMPPSLGTIIVILFGAFLVVGIGAAIIVGIAGGIIPLAPIPPR